MADADSRPLPVAWPLLNDTSLGLLLLTVVLGVYATYLVRPRPLVHPLLLGRQSEVSQTREKGQSGVYRSFAAGHGPPLTVRPAGALKTLVNVLDPSCTARFVYGEKISNDLLRLRAHNVGKGLHALFRLESVASGTGGIVNLLPDGFDSVLLTLALALEPSPTHALVTLSTPHLLAYTLERPTPPLALVLPARLAQSVLEQLIDEGATSMGVKPALIIVGAEEEAGGIIRLAEKHGLVAVAWRDVEVAGNGVEDKAERQVVGEQDVFGLRIWEAPGGKVLESRLTHVNLTAGIAGLLALFPAHKRPSSTSNDTIASVLSLNTPAGLALLFASLWSGAGFRTFGSGSGWEQPSDDDDDEPDVVPESSPAAELASALLLEAAKPTILFLTASQLAALTHAIQEVAKRSPLYSIARRQILADLSEGFLAREGRLEKYFWSGVRKGVMGGLASLLRAVIVVDSATLGGGLNPTLLQAARVHLATPVTNLTTSTQSTTPVFVTHFHDLQTMPSSVPPVSAGLRELQFTPTSSATYDKSKQSVVPGELVLPTEGVAHTGPPAVNIEVRLEGVDDEQIEEGEEDPRGEVWVRGPGVLGEGWTKTDLRAQALKNGTFSLL